MRSREERKEGKEERKDSNPTLPSELLSSRAYRKGRRLGEDEGKGKKGGKKKRKERYLFFLFASFAGSESRLPRESREGLEKEKRKKEGPHIVTPETIFLWHVTGFLYGTEREKKKVGGGGGGVVGVKGVEWGEVG